MFGEQASREEILGADFSLELKLDGNVYPKGDWRLILLCGNESPPLHRDEGGAIEQLITG
jgi:hypothetical protein